MAEEALLEQLISREGAKERNAILSEAGQEAKKIRTHAEEEARRALERHQPIFQALADSAHRRLILQAEFEAQIRVTTEKQNVIQQVMARVAEKCQEIVRHPEYGSLLEDLLQEALALTQKPEQVQVRPEDVGFVQEVLRRLGQEKLEVAGNLKGWGGVRLISEKGKLVFDNTLESRFLKAQEVYKEEIAKDLFG